MDQREPGYEAPPAAAPEAPETPPIVVEGGEVVAVQTSENQGAPLPPVVPFSETEVQAAQLGWKPREFFEGRPEDWRSAKDFIERGEMIGRIRSQSQKIQSIEQALKHVTTANAKIYANGYEQAIKDLQVKRREALQDGDIMRAEDLSEQIDATRVEARKAVENAVAPIRELDKQPQGPDPDHVRWAQSNPWYDEIPTMRRFADAAAIEFVKENAGKVTPNQVRKYIGELIREEFPHRFRGAVAPNPDGAGRGNRGSGGDQRFSKIEAGMSEDETRIMKTLIKSTGMTKAEYLKMYSEAR